MALVLILYWPALRHPYRLDDFAWLCLRNTVTAGRSLWWALFSPQAQGTIRPLGERLWFLLASSLFGLNPVPLHLLALCTQVANVLLMADTGWRLTGSRHAAAIAAILWVINDALVDPIVWASAFNEVLYTFWLLLAFNAFLRGISSRRPVWLVVQLLAYLLALGTLELAVMFPAIAAAYVILFERSRWKDVLPSAVLSAAFIAIHLWAVPLPQGGPYKLTLGWGVLGNLLHRWATVLGPEEYGRIHPINFSGTNLPGMNFPANFVLTRLATVAMSTAILLWAAVSARVGRSIPGFLSCLVCDPLGADVAACRPLRPVLCILTVDRARLARGRCHRPGRHLARPFCRACMRRPVRRVPDSVGTFRARLGPGPIPQHGRARSSSFGIRP